MPFCKGIFMKMFTWSYHRVSIDKGSTRTEQKSDIVVILVYMDDLIITRSNAELIDEANQTLHNSFKVKDLGELRYFLGAKSISTPIEPNQKLTTIEYDKHVGVNGDEKLEDIGSYQKLISELFYLTITRPDLSFVVQVLRSIDTLSAYCDSNWASCPNTSRFITGYVIKLGDFLLSWKLKKQQTYIDVDRKAVEKNFRAKKILICGIGYEEYNRISICDTTKEIWEALQTTHEGTTQVKQSKIDMYTTEYELFRMKDDESIQDMHTRFTYTINELHSLGETIPRNKLVRKILSILPSPWESKVNAITESKDLHELTIEDLVGNLKTYEMNRKIDSERKEPAWGDSSGESEDETNASDSSMMAVEGEENEYDSAFALITQSDDDEDDHNKEDRDSLTLELGEAEQTRDDLVDVVIDHKKTIENFKEERNDLLEVIADLRETIERPETNSKPRNSEKGKEIASEEHIRLENELKAVRTRMCVETEKNKYLQTDLERGIGFQREKTPYNPHSKYVIVSDNWLCTHCGKMDTSKKIVRPGFNLFRKNKVFAEKGTVKGSGQQWFMDSGCSKHMTGNTMDFLSLKALQRGSISFGNGKKGYILGVGKVGKSLTHSIENVYYVNDLKYSP
ncbi:uncharacterized protein [Nicotiana sylvestris]|uniref:uncharacterized protein n=1 Tax=Nicotiana sylvestris TaxID=4096 RepID=UPI00388C7339